MKKNSLRRFIWIPNWRVDELEAWLSNMAAQGWMLKTIDLKRACFERTEIYNLRYYCHIFDETDYTVFGDREETLNQKQITEVKLHGWKYVARYGRVGVFVSAPDAAAELPVSPDKEEERIISLYKKTAGSIKRPVLISFLMLAFVAYCLFIQYGLHKLLVSPWLQAILFLSIYSVLNIPFRLIRRVMILQKIKACYKQEPPHSLQPGTCTMHGIRHQMRAEKIKLGIAVILIMALILPATPYYSQVMVFGLRPPIPNGDLPVVGLSDLKPGFHPAEFKDRNISNFYRSYSTLILPRYSLLFESDGTSEVVSEYFHTMAPWYASLLAGSDLLAISICDEEFKNPENYGFSKIWISKLIMEI